jgi:general L-amino acid transport system substrate-binding protein
MSDHSDDSDDILSSSILDAGDDDGDDDENQHSDSSLPQHQPPAIAGLSSDEGSSVVSSLSGGGMRLGNSLSSHGTLGSSIKGEAPLKLVAPQQLDDDDSDFEVEVDLESPKTAKENPVFRLAAPQILDSDDSDIDLDEDQRPSSQPFSIKDWEEDDPDAQQPSQPFGSSGEMRSTTSSIRRHSAARQPKKRESNAWGELSINIFSGGQTRPSVTGGIYNKSPNPSASFGDLEISSRQLNQGQPNQASNEQPVSPRPASSKILERMKKGIAAGAPLTFTDYHDANVRTSTFRPKFGVDVVAQQRQLEQFYRRILYAVASIICLLVITVVVVVIVLLLQNAADDSNSASLQQQPPVTPSMSPTIVKSPSPTSMPSSSPTASPPTLAPTAEPTVANPLDTLDSILARGRLSCGIVEAPGLASRTDSGDWQGMDVDWCKAIAAAILGDPAAVNFLPVTQASRFPTLLSGAIDILSAGTTFTMERNVFEPSSQVGFDFSIPYLYNGMSFAGDPLFLECAEDQDLTTVNDSTGKNCPALSICVVDSTTHGTVVERLMPNVTIVRRSSFAEMYPAYGNGLCNVLAGEQPQVAESVVRQANANVGNFRYLLGTETFSKEPIALVTRNTDPKWSDYCSWILQALIFAEEQGIDALTAEAMPETSVFAATTVFSTGYTRSFIQAVQAVGNYGDVYNRHLGSIVPRQPVNQVNTNGDTGVLYSLPLGNLETVGAAGQGLLTEINSRGFLRCGITRRPVFAEFNTDTRRWQGIDVDICHAISASIFDGIFSTIEYVDLYPVELFDAMDRNEIDVISRLSTISIDRDVSGHSFSHPIFYDRLAFGGVAPYVECANELNSSGDTCQDLRICMEEGTIFQQQVTPFFPTRFLVFKATSESAVQGLGTGECNVLAGGILDVSEYSVRTNGYTGSYVTEASALSVPHVPMAVATRQDDPVWSTFVFWIVNALIYAEENGITQATSRRMPVVDLFGRLNFRVFRDAVGAAGSLGEIYDRNAGSSSVEREGLNLLNTNPLGPQLRSYPLL